MINEANYLQLGCQQKQMQLTNLTSAFHKHRVILLKIATETFLLGLRKSAELIIVRFVYHMISADDKIWPTLNS